MRIWEEVYQCIKDRKRVLEIGCGVGDFVKYLSSRGMHVTGIDPYEGLEEGRNYRIMKAYAEDLPFADGEFDAVVSVRTLHHTDARTALTEIYRVLKENGTICISDWKKGAETGINEEYFSPTEVKNMLLDIGFKNIGFFPCADDKMMLVLGQK